MAPPVSLTDWHARNLKELRSIWDGLRPDLDAGDAERTFRGQMLTAKQAGEVFERWVLEAFRLSGTAGHYSYTVSVNPEGGRVREQIDGLLFGGWQGFVVESKFWAGKVDFGPLALLAHLVELRPVGTLGLFFSGFGYTAPALLSAELMRPIRVLLFDERDLTWAVSANPFKGRMAEMVRRKWALAVKFGRLFMPVSLPLGLFE